MSLGMLARYGWQEAELRERPLEWIGRLTKSLGQQLRTELANQLSLMGLAAALPHGAQESFQEALDDLQRDEDELTHLLDPNAQTDYQALRRFANTAGGVQQQHKEESNA